MSKKAINGVSPCHDATEQELKNFLLNRGIDSIKNLAGYIPLVDNSPSNVVFFLKRKRGFKWNENLVKYKVRLSEGLIVSEYFDDDGHNLNYRGECGDIPF